MFQNQLWFEYGWFPKDGTIETGVWELVVIPPSAQQWPQPFLMRDGLGNMVYYKKGSCNLRSKLSEKPCLL